MKISVLNYYNKWTNKLINKNQATKKWHRWEDRQTGTKRTGVGTERQGQKNIEEREWSKKDVGGGREWSKKDRGETKEKRSKKDRKGEEKKWGRDREGEERNREEEESKKRGHPQTSKITGGTRVKGRTSTNKLII